MKVLWVIWCLLKIIGILVGSIIGILVISMILVFVVPIHYEFTFEKWDQLMIQYKFTWFYSLIGYQYRWKQNDRQQNEFHILGWKRRKQVVLSKVKETAELPVEKSNIHKEDLKRKKRRVKNQDKFSKEESKQNNDKKTMNFKERDETKIAGDDEEKEIDQKFWKNMMKEYPYKQALIKEVYCFCKNLIFYILPKQYHVSWEFGLEDPAQTGYMLGLVSMVSPFCGENIHIRGNFQEEIMEGFISGEGKIRIGSIIKKMILFLWNPPIRTLIKMYFKQRKEGNKNGK
ncbi:MAG: DUF2953 domain-containing protein [Epulopiscium sp.]|nr:DUF2953 domain-containing protein [Candidatus Epulonipiscium sp.]